MSARMIVLAPVDGDPRIQEFALRPLIISTVDRRSRIKEVLHIEKHETVCDLCGGLIAITKKELGERTKGYAVIVDGRIVQIICEEYRRRFWRWIDEEAVEEFRRMMGGDHERLSASCLYRVCQDAKGSIDRTRSSRRDA